jgi:hypothetical protein
MNVYREKANAYTREYRKENPEKVLKWRISSAVRLLRANGYEVRERATEPAQKGTNE